MSGGHLPHRTWADKSIRCTCSACAEIDRLRAELAEQFSDWQSTCDELHEALTAIARVRALILEDGGDAFFEASEISRALDGGSE